MSGNSEKKQKFIRTFLELKDDYDFINFALLEYVLQVGLYPIWPGKKGEKLSDEQELEYQNAVFEHASKVYLTKPKWFFEAAETRKELENEKNTPLSVDFKGFESKNYLPDGYFERRVSPPGLGKRPIRSTPPPKGFIRLTITVPVGLHSFLKSRAFEMQTTITSVMQGIFERMDGVFERMASGFEPNAIRRLEHIEETYSKQAGSKRLSVNVPAKKHFMLKEKAERRSLTLNKLIIQALILELYDLENEREGRPVSKVAPKDVFDSPVAVAALDSLTKPLSSVPKPVFDEDEDEESPGPRM
jgi:hypothetical protein